MDFQHPQTAARFVADGNLGYLAIAAGLRL